MDSLLNELEANVQEEYVETIAYADDLYVIKGKFEWEIYQQLK